MPLVALGIAGGLAGGAASIYGAHKQSQASDQAAAIQQKSSDQAIALQKQQLDQDKAQWEAQQRSAQQQFDQQQSLRAPYRAAGQAALSKLGDVLGLSFQGYQSPGQPSGGGGNGDAPPATGAARQVIDDWQATHHPSEGTSGLIAALTKAGVNASPYLYGSTPSGNEIALNGQKYKVIAGENSSNPSWYVAGTPDGPGGAPAGAGRNLSALGIRPLYDVTQAPYSQAVPFRSLMGA